MGRPRRTVTSAGTTRAASMRYPRPPAQRAPDPDRATVDARSWSLDAMPSSSTGTRCSASSNPATTPRTDWI
jgi:hypothetical protein